MNDQKSINCSCVRSSHIPEPVLLLLRKSITPKLSFRSCLDARYSIEPRLVTIISFCHGEDGQFVLFEHRRLSAIDLKFVVRCVVTDNQVQNRRKHLNDYEPISNLSNEVIVFVQTGALHPVQMLLGTC